MSSQSSGFQDASDKGSDYVDDERISAEDQNNENNSNHPQTSKIVQMSPDDFGNEDITTLVSHINPICEKLKSLRYQAKEVMDNIGDLETFMRASANVQEENQRLKHELQNAKEKNYWLKGSGGTTTSFTSVFSVAESMTPSSRRSKTSVNTSELEPSTSICQIRLANVQTEPWMFIFSDLTTVIFRASDYILNEFTSTLAFENCKNDIAKFCVQVIIGFLRKPEFQNTIWTVTISGKARGTMVQLPNAFIYDVVYVAVVGFGADPNRCHWTTDDFDKFARISNNTLYTLRDRLANARMNDRKRKYNEFFVNDGEAMVVNIGRTYMFHQNSINKYSVNAFASEESPQ